MESITHYQIILQSLIKVIYIKLKGRNLIELKIPMAYFYLEDSAFNCHFDAHLLQSSHFIKSIILNNIEHMYNTSHHDDKVIPKIIQTFIKKQLLDILIYIFQRFLLNSTS